MNLNDDEDMLEMWANGLWSEGQGAWLLEHDCHNVVTDVSLSQQLMEQNRHTHSNALKKQASAIKMEQFEMCSISRTYNKGFKNNFIIPNRFFISKQTFYLTLVFCMCSNFINRFIWCNINCLVLFLNTDPGGIVIAMSSIIGIKTNKQTSKQKSWP